MPTTIGIFLLTNPQHVNSLSTINDRLLIKFNPVPLGGWGLDHRLLRSTPSSPGDTAAPRFQHLLRLSYHPKTVYVAVSPSAEAAAGTPETIVTIPSNQYDSFINLLTARFTALWAPRTYLHVVNGKAYTVGEFIIRLGDLRQTGGPHPVRGLVCCIEASSTRKEDGGIQSPDQAKKQEESTTALMANLWARIGFEGAKEVFISSSSTTEETAGEGFEEARLWCDLLRLRT